jgi:hypothetical protein
MVSPKVPTLRLPQNSRPPMADPSDDDVFGGMQAMEHPRGPLPRPKNTLKTPDSALTERHLKRVAPEPLTSTRVGRRPQPPAVSNTNPTGGVPVDNNVISVRRTRKWAPTPGLSFGASSPRSNQKNPQGDNDRARMFQGEVSGIPGPSSSGKQFLISSLYQNQIRITHKVTTTGRGCFKVRFQGFLARLQAVSSSSLVHYTKIKSE